MRVKREIGEDHLALLGAGLSFYAMLAIFPALIAVVTIYGLVGLVPPLMDHLGLGGIGRFLAQVAR